VDFRHVIHVDLKCDIASTLILINMKTWITTAEAARRLGVKPATVYAYVSRGVLRRRRDEDGRRSLFDAAQVEELARGGRPRRPPAPAELVIESSITALRDGRPFYRGRDALELAGSWSFEQAALWLWNEGADDAVPWPAVPDALPPAVAAQSGLPAGTLPRERLQVITAALAATDPLRHVAGRAAAITTGQRFITAMLDCLPAVGPCPGRRIEERLWRALCPAPADPDLLAVLRSALIVLADHELAASTLAVRIAASTRADPYTAVAAGLAAVAGPLHGGASLAVELLLDDIGSPADAGRVIGDRLRRGERIPGFGHTIYQVDRRGNYLLGRLREIRPEHRLLAIADEMLAVMERRRLPAPNTDLALAVLTRMAGMIDGAAEAVFVTARTAGWLAHAFEEYDRDRLLRARAVYIGD
jgi:citrate synthase